MARPSPLARAPLASSPGSAPGSPTEGVVVFGRRVRRDPYGSKARKSGKEGAGYGGKSAKKGAGYGAKSGHGGKSDKADKSDYGGGKSYDKAAKSAKAKSAKAKSGKGGRHDGYGYGDGGAPLVASEFDGAAGADGGGLAGDAPGAETAETGVPGGPPVAEEASHGSEDASTQDHGGEDAPSRDDTVSADGADGAPHGEDAPAPDGAGGSVAGGGEGSPPPDGAAGSDGADGVQGGDVSSAVTPPSPSVVDASSESFPVVSSAETPPSSSDVGETEEGSDDDGELDDDSVLDAVEGSLWPGAASNVDGAVAAPIEGSPWPGVVAGGEGPTLLGRGSVCGPPRAASLGRDLVVDCTASASCEADGDCDGGLSCLRDVACSPVEEAAGEEAPLAVSNDDPSVPASPAAEASAASEDSPFALVASPVGTDGPDTSRDGSPPELVSVPLSESPPPVLEGALIGAFSLLALVALVAGPLALRRRRRDAATSGGDREPLAGGRRRKRPGEGTMDFSLLSPAAAREGVKEPPDDEEWFDDGESDATAPRGNVTSSLAAMGAWSAGSWGAGPASASKSGGRGTARRGNNWPGPAEDEADVSMDVNLGLNLSTVSEGSDLVPRVIEEDAPADAPAGEEWRQGMRLARRGLPPPAGDPPAPSESPAAPTPPAATEFQTFVRANSPSDGSADGDSSGAGPSESPVEPGPTEISETPTLSPATPRSRPAAAPPASGPSPATETPACSPAATPSPTETPTFSPTTRPLTPAGMPTYSPTATPSPTEIPTYSPAAAPGPTEKPTFTPAAAPRSRPAAAPPATGPSNGATGPEPPEPPATPGTAVTPAPDRAGGGPSGAADATAGYGPAPVVAAPAAGGGIGLQHDSGILPRPGMRPPAALAMQRTPLRASLRTPLGALRSNNDNNLNPPTSDGATAGKAGGDPSRVSGGSGLAPRVI